MCDRGRTKAVSKYIQETREQTHAQWIQDYDEAEENEMNLDELVPSTSKYLAKEDVGIVGENLTIERFTRETVGTGSDADERAVIHWQEGFKPMVLNKTNKNRIKHYLDAKTSEEVIGKTVNVYNDPDIEFGGEIVGGLRIRAAQEVPTPHVRAVDALDDSDIPF